MFVACLDELLFVMSAKIRRWPPGAEIVSEEETSNAPWISAFVVAMSTLDATSF